MFEVELWIAIDDWFCVATKTYYELDGSPPHMASAWMMTKAMTKTDEELKQLAKDYGEQRRHGSAAGQLGSRAPWTRSRRFDILGRMPLSVPEAAQRVLDVLKTNGWFQDRAESTHYGGWGPNDELCLLRAVQTLPTWRRLNDALCQHLGLEHPPLDWTILVTWNDAPERTIEDVYEALEALGAKR